MPNVGFQSGALTWLDLYMYEPKMTNLWTLGRLAYTAVSKFGDCGFPKSLIIKTTRDKEFFNFGALSGQYSLFFLWFQGPGERWRDILPV